MSTRANIIIKDNYNHLYFYRHSDGYPSGVEASLDRLCFLMNEGIIRASVSQGAGHLVMLGAVEYGADYEYEKIEKGFMRRPYGDPETALPVKAYSQAYCDREDFPENSNMREEREWKVGAYEPTTDLHGDIEHLYVIDLANPKEKITWEEIEPKQVPRDFNGREYMVREWPEHDNATLLEQEANAREKLRKERDKQQAVAS